MENEASRQGTHSVGPPPSQEVDRTERDAERAASPPALRKAVRTSPPSTPSQRKGRPKSPREGDLNPGPSKSASLPKNTRNRGNSPRFFRGLCPLDDPVPSLVYCFALAPSLPTSLGFSNRPPPVYAKHLPLLILSFSNRTPKATALAIGPFPGYI